MADVNTIPCGGCNQIGQQGLRRVQNYDALLARIQNLIPTFAYDDYICGACLQFMEMHPRRIWHSLSTLSTSRVTEAESLDVPEFDRFVSEVQIQSTPVIVSVASRFPVFPPSLANARVEREPQSSAQPAIPESESVFRLSSTPTRKSDSGNGIEMDPNSSVEPACEAIQNTANSGNPTAPTDIAAFK